MNVGRPKKLEEDKAKPTDRIKCDICGIIYVRSGRTLHNRTRIHQIYSNIKDKKENEKNIPDNIKNYIIDMYEEVYLADKDIKYLNNPKISYNKKISYIDNIVNGT